MPPKKSGNLETQRLTLRVFEKLKNPRTELLTHNQDDIERDAVVLACYSKNFFIEHLSKAKANPLVWTTGLMAPEAYTLHDAITGFVNGEEDQEIRLRAAQAYSNYQKCSLRAAKNLLVTN